jgi:ADP-ribosylglycohydrolase
MRTLPVALVSYRDFDRLVADTFRHTIVTHGHPRAIVGALVLGLAVRRSLGGQLEDLPSALIQDLHEARASLEGADDYRPWVAKWNVVGEGSFQRVLSLAFAEITSMLRLAESAPNTRQFMEDVGAFKPETRGSGTATVASAIYIAARSNNNPPERIREAATALGADTDTIAAMTGAILGALLGTNALPADLASDIQDRRYLDATATSLASAARGASEARTSRQTPMNKGEVVPLRFEDHGGEHLVPVVGVEMEHLGPAPILFDLRLHRVPERHKHFAREADDGGFYHFRTS